MTLEQFINLPRFRVKCPKCKKSFGVSPETVMKYMDRLLEEIKEVEKGNAGRKSQKREV